MVSNKGKSIMDAIRYLDDFYSDLGLMINNFENLLSEKGFVSIPNAGNRATYYYDVSNHVGRSKKWTLKNIQRLYLKEDETESDKNNKNINKAILCSLVLYPSSAFEIPVLICGVLSWDGNYSQNEIYNLWPSREICELVYPKNNWRLKNKQEVMKKKQIYKFVPLDKLRNISDFSLVFVDLVKIESSKVLQKIVDALIELYNGSDEVSIESDLVVDSIPEKLLENWSQPIRAKDVD